MELVRCVSYVLILCLLAIGCNSPSDQPPPLDETSEEEITLPRLEELEETPETDVPYVPTPQNVVEKMLQMAEVTANDTVYDLGSGDGRIVITAAEKYGAHGVGIEIDPRRVEEARDNAEAAGVADLVTFREENLFDVDLSPATVVTLYLLPEINRQLRPKLLDELRPGTPIVSHDFDMGAWRPERRIDIDGSALFFWTVPEEPPVDLPK